MNEQPQQPARTTLAAVQQGGNLPDQKIDMFTERGFALAQRIANAYATANAVPACFRHTITKREKQNGEYVDIEVPNEAALGNCIVAIETAQAVGMSITAVMQNANMIEGKLSWSAQFVIAAVNASRRFTPLRFQMKNLGRITAKYNEKGSWNKDARKFNMIEREIEIDDTECIAWALPAGTHIPANVTTLEQAKAAGLPVIEGAPVSIKMAVEEGWYAKSGSKWQTSMRSLMLQYRAGAFFGRIHAPDVVMGMGRTSEEAEELIDLNEPPVVATSTPVNDLRNRRAEDAQVVEAKPAAAAQAEAVHVVDEAAPAQQQEAAASQPEEAQPAEPTEGRAAANAAAVDAALGIAPKTPTARTRRAAPSAE